MKKLWLVSLAAVMVLLLAAPAVALAAEQTGEQDEWHYTEGEILFENLPADAVYADVLVKKETLMSKSPRHGIGGYVDCAMGIYQLGLRADCEWAQYEDADGYVSYTAHRDNAGPAHTVAITATESGQPRAALWRNVFKAHYESLRQRTRFIKIAVVDADGTVLAVSNAVDIDPPPALYFENRITFDVQSGIARPYTSLDILALFAYFISGFGFWYILAAAAKTLLSLCFSIKPWDYVLRTSLVSTVILLGAVYVLAGVLGVPFIPVIVTGEVLAAFGEYFWYRKKEYRDFPRKKLAAFVAVSNAASSLVWLLTLSLPKYLLPITEWVGSLIRYGSFLP